MWTQTLLAAGLVVSSGDPGGGSGGGGAWVMLGVYAALALGVSFLCSLLEASILSLPRSHVALLIEQGKPIGKTLERMKNNLDRPLAAILTLNTIAHTIGAAGVGAQVLIIFGDAWVFIGSIIITLLILYLSEIIPKGLGATFAKPLSGFTGRTIAILEFIVAPFVWVAMGISKMVGGMEAAHVTREEVAVFARMGLSAGELKEQEATVIANLLALRDTRVCDVMTPRSVMFCFEKSQTVEQVIAEHGQLRFARIPVYEGNRDHMVGLLMRKDILEALGNDRHDTPVAELMKPLRSVRGSEPVASAIDLMIAHREHLLRVEDEFGHTLGLVTLEDGIETLLGVEIIDETDRVADMRELARQRAAERDQ